MPQVRLTGQMVVSDNGLISALGDKLKVSGIDVGGLLKGLVSIAATLIISKMMNKNTAANTMDRGGLSGLLGGGRLCKLFNMLSGGKGTSGATGFISKLFG